MEKCIRKRTNNSINSNVERKLEHALDAKIIHIKRANQISCPISMHLHCVTQLKLRIEFLFVQMNRIEFYSPKVINIFTRTMLFSINMIMSKLISLIYYFLKPDQ